MLHGMLCTHALPRLDSAFLEGSHPVLNIDSARQRVVAWSNEQVWLAQAVDNTSRLMQPEHHVASDTWIVAWARLDNRAELTHALNMAGQEAVLMSDAQLILRAYLHYGEACTTHLWGDYCFAIYNARDRVLFCARDRMGAKPFYYYADERMFVFSTSLALFHALDCVPVRPCMRWASQFLVANLSMDFHETAYQNIFKLPPAEQLHVADGACKKSRYFSFHTNKIHLNSSDAYIDLYRDALELAVKSRVQTSHPLGSEMSGGIDSSTVTALAAKYHTGSRDDIYTFGFAHLEQEPRYILQVNQQYNLSNSYICCHNPSRRYDPHRALQALGAPVEHTNATGHEIFYDVAAKHGVRTLLSGFGGDEFVTTIHGDLYLYELLKNKQYWALYNNLLGNPLMRALRFAKLRHSSDKHSGKISPLMRRAFDARWPDVIVSDHLLRAYSIQETYERLGDFDTGYSDLDQFTLERRWVPFVATRMENCTLMAASYGVDYRWPLLDARLIQCFLSIPSAEKFHKGIGRYLHRRAIEGTVPKDIVWKAGKYMGERMNASAMEETRLHDDLHPDLLPLLNLPRLKKQALEGSSQGRDFKKNISRVNQLDDWLKYYFEKGCDWANTPVDA